MAGERRTITMLFADLQGSTAAAEQLDPEEWAEIVNGAFERLIRPVYRYEGTLARLMGDAILAFFGAPIAHEDDPERAVMAGLEMLKAAKPYARQMEARWGVPFDLRVGINTGLVVVGEVGSDLRVEYSALGDAVNVAARMEQTALPGTLQITESTHRLVSQLFEFEELEPVEAKGKSEPVPAFRVIGVTERPSTIRGILGRDAPLVGRDDELATLRDVIDNVRRGKGQVISLIGEAGVGKSKLAAALKADLAAQECLAPWLSDTSADRDVRWAEARCLSFNSSVAYGPFIDLFTRTFELHPDDHPPEKRSKVEAAVTAVLPEAPLTATYLGVMLGIDPPEDQDEFISELSPPVLQKRVFAAVVDYVEACSLTSPGVLVVEDLHWADPVSLALLDELVRATDRSMLAIIALMRPYREDAAWGFHEMAERSFSHRYTSVRLDPLDQSTSRVMISELLNSADLPEGLFAVVVDKADGNPFFVEEILRQLLETGSLTHTDGGWQFTGEAATVSVPGGITGLLTARLDRLDDASRLVLQLASVLGREFEFGELTSLTANVEETDAALSDLMRRDLLTERSRIPTRNYTFRHALIQEAAYDTILLKTRRALHAQIAEHLIAAEAEPHEIAHHLIESRQELAAVPYLAEAGDRASRAMSLADAIRFYDKALSWGTEDSDLAVTRRIYEGLGAAYTLIPDLTEASASFQRMLEFGRERAEPSVQITALNRLGFTAAALGGDYESATDFLEEARRLAEAFGDGPGLAEYHINSCMIATTRGDMEKAAAHDAETIRIGGDVGSVELHLGGLLQRVVSLIHGAQWDEASRSFERAREAAGGSSNPNVKAMLAVSEYYFLLRNGDVTRAWELSRATAENAHAGSSMASTIALMAGFAAALLGDYENAIALCAQARRFGEETGQIFNSASAAAAMARAYAELGIDGSETAKMRADALAYLELPMGETLASSVFADLGWAALDSGRVSEADEMFTTGISGTSAMKMLELPSLLFGLAAVRTMQGDFDASAALIGEASDFTVQQGMATFRPLEAETRGSLLIAQSQYESAADVLSAGIDAAREMGMKAFEWRLLAALAGVLGSKGQTEPSREAAEAARRVVSEQANGIVDVAMRDSFVQRATARIDHLLDAAAARGGAGAGTDLI